MGKMIAEFKKKNRDALAADEGASKQQVHNVWEGFDCRGTRRSIVRGFWDRRCGWNGEERLRWFVMLDLVFET
jgi:hypothetical protein